MSEDRPIGEDDLQAWVDGRLTPERSTQVDAWLAQHPAEGARVATYRQHRDELRRCLAAKAEAPVPLRLRASALQTVRRAGLRRRLSLAAASIALLAGGGAAGWIARSQQLGAAVANAQAAPARIAVDAMRAHLTYVAENRHAVEVPASQEEHLIQWLSNRLRRRLVVPDLTPLGFRLMGGRLLPTEDAPAAQFMFEDDRGTRLTLYIRAEPLEGGTGFEMVARDGVHGFRWIDQGFGFAVLAAAGRERLLAIAQSVDRQLAPEPPGPL